MSKSPKCVSPSINQLLTEMECPSETINFRKHEEDDHGGVIFPSPLKKWKGDGKSAPNQTEYGDLIAGLGNAFLLGEVITRLPWYQRPILTMLNQSWAHALRHSFPFYARLHHPRILSKLIVLSRSPRHKTPCNSREDLALWAYNHHHCQMRNLPVPAIPVDLQQHVKFVCDDNDESIYSFTRVHEKGVYDVQVLDLREGGCSPWKRLPSLPIYHNDCEYYVYRCFSMYENCSITYMVYMRNNFMEEDPYAFSLWTFTVTANENDCEGQLWQCQCFRSSPFVFSADEKKPPLYVEINKWSLYFTGFPRFSEKSLYQRCKRLDDNEAPYERWGRGYLLMLFQEDTVGQPAYSFYEIGAHKDGVKFYKMTTLEDAESSRRIVEDAEGAPFWDFWRSWIDGATLMEEGEERSAIQISIYDKVMLGRREGNGNDLDIRVAQRSHSLYLYRLISF